MSCSHKITGNRVYDFIYNPYEILIHGQTSEIRGRLAAKIAALFSADFNVGHVIEREPGPENPPDETSGVSLIRGGGQNGLLYDDAMDDYLRPRPLIDVDVAIVESSADMPLPKIVWVDDGLPPEHTNILAYVGDRASCPILPASADYFSDDQFVALKRHIQDYFADRVASVPLYGLVLTGGKSTRMGEDKAAIAYHGRSQVDYCYELLSAVCDDVFVSLRSEQGDESTYANFPQIADAFLGFGPMGGILSAQKAHPHAAWLVLACDLPYVSKATIDYLLAQRNPFKLATAYISANDGFPEPLCAIYEPKSIFRLMQFLALGYHCPRKVLINSDTWLLELPEAQALDNANTPDERDKAYDAVASNATNP